MMSPVSSEFMTRYCNNCSFEENCFMKSEDCEDFIQKGTKQLSALEKLGWISVLDTAKLPAIGTWVSVLQDKSGHTEGDILPSGEPNYWFAQDYYYAKMRGEWMKKVTAASIRSIDDEGWPDWEQGRMPSGYAFKNIRYVTHWQPLPDLP